MRTITHIVIRTPTPKGVEAFGWKPAVTDWCESLEAAQESAYLEAADEPAPDKYDYTSWVIVPLPQPMYMP